MDEGHLLPDFVDQNHVNIFRAIPINIRARNHDTIINRMSSLCIRVPRISPISLGIEQVTLVRQEEHSNVSN